MPIKLPSSEYRITLKTAEKRLAKHFASGLGVFTASCFEKIRRMKSKTPNIPLTDFLSQLDAERQRLGQNFLDHVGVNTPEEQLAAIVEMVEAMPEGPIREVGHSLMH